MIGCPSREQLSNVMAERTSAEERAEIGEHTRSCPECRRFLEVLSREGTTALERGFPDPDATVARAGELSAEAPATWPESPRAGEPTLSDSAPPETVDLPGPAPAPLPATEVGVRANGTSSASSGSAELPATVADMQGGPSEASRIFARLDDEATTPSDGTT